MHSFENAALVPPSLSEEQSTVTPTIMEFAATLPTEQRELVGAISDCIQSLRTKNTEEVDFSRKPDEIIKSGYSQGCHEDGLLFVTFLRAKGMQATYIQTFLRNDLIHYGEADASPNRGHVFIRLQTPDGDNIVNASSGEITQEIPDEYVLGKEGIDSWHIGLKTRKDYINLFLETKKNLGY